MAALCAGMAAAARLSVASDRANITMSDNLTTAASSDYSSGTMRSGD